MAMSDATQKAINNKVMKKKAAAEKEESAAMSYVPGSEVGASTAGSGSFANMSKRNPDPLPPRMEGKNEKIDKLGANGMDGDAMFESDENAVFKLSKGVEVDISDDAPAPSGATVREQPATVKLQGKEWPGARSCLFDLCNMFEECGECMLQHALMDPQIHAELLEARDEMLNELYQLRYLSDVDDEYFQDEFEQDMRRLKQYRSKMGRLDGKENPEKDSDDSSSDDTDGDDDWAALLKKARKTMQYAFGVQPEALAYREDMRQFAKNYNTFNYDGERGNTGSTKASAPDPFGTKNKMVLKIQGSDD